VVTWQRSLIFLLPDKIVVCTQTAEPALYHSALLHLAGGEEEKVLENGTEDAISSREVKPHQNLKEITMLKRLSVMLFAATLLSGCFVWRSSPPPREVVVTTTPPVVAGTTTVVTCPAGTTLRSDGRCW